MCSRVCYGAAAGDDGVFSIPVGAYLRSSDYALHVSGRPSFADVYTKVPAAANDAIAIGAPIRLPALPANGPMLPTSPTSAASRIESAGLALDLPAGVSLTVDVADVALGDLGRQLRVAAVPTSDTPDFARRLPGVAAMFAIAPPGAVASAPLGVHITNDAALPPGTAVEILVLDDDYAPLPPTAGTARPAAKAHVSADGRTIDTDEGEGITHLTWLILQRL